MRGGVGEVEVGVGEVEVGVGEVENSRTFIFLLFCSFVIFHFSKLFVLVVVVVSCMLLLVVFTVFNIPFCRVYFLINSFCSWCCLCLHVADWCGFYCNILLNSIFGSQKKYINLTLSLSSLSLSLPISL